MAEAYAAASLIGHEAARSQMLQALGSSGLHHAWLLTGPQGIGKATLAYHFARSLLAGSGELPLDSAHPIARRVSAGFHPDLHVLKRLMDEKKDELKRDITVEQVREVASFMAHTPAESARRLVIIDSADDLNPNAANALLKLLEEPPSGGVLLLVSHQPGRLLPTIRSRCRQLRLGLLSETQAQAVLAQAGGEATEAEALLRLFPGAPGLALEMAGQGAGSLYAALIDVFRAWPKLATGDILTLAGRIPAAAPHAAFALTGRLLLKLIERAVAQGLGEELAEAADGEGLALKALLDSASPSRWAERHARISHDFSLAAGLHLDYKTSLITTLETMAA